MNLIQRLFRCTAGCQINQHGKFDYEKPSDQVRLWFWDKWDWLVDRPRSFRRALALKLRWWAACVSGEKYTDGGYGMKYNEAARIQDALVMHLVLARLDANEDATEEIDELFPQIDRLAYLAGANWYDEEEEAI